MRESLAERVTSGIDDVARRIKVWLTDFEMNNIASLCFERFRFTENFECRFGAKTRRAMGESELVCLSHDVKSQYNAVA